MSDPPAGGVEGIRAYYRKVAPFLERECAGRRDGGFWRGVAREHRGGRVLELGAGTGRVTELLAGEAREVVAVDISPEMLRRARERLGDRRHVHLVEGDMTRIRFQRVFDAVVIANDPFVHLLDDDERDAGIATAAAHLDVGGRLVLDGLWFPPEKRERAATDEGVVIEREACDDDELVIHQEWRVEPDDPFYRARFEYRWEGTVLSVAEFRARIWTPGEVGRRLALHGVAPASRWGGYGRRGFDAGASTRILVDARKVKGPSLSGAGPEARGRDGGAGAKRSEGPEGRRR